VAIAQDTALFYRNAIMTTDEINLIGYMAAACTTLCWLPQAVRTIRTRDTAAISLWTQALFAIGTMLWLIYGLYVASIPIILANAITLLLVLVILAMKIRYG
jgi:MtN3 and saliva related transmembrane protein